jgi:hypothetical protein
MRMIAPVWRPVPQAAPAVGRLRLDDVNSDAEDVIDKALDAYPDRASRKALPLTTTGGAHSDRGPLGGSGHAPPTTTNLPFWLVAARSHAVRDWTAGPARSGVSSSADEQGVRLAKPVWLRCLRVFVDQSVQDGASGNLQVAGQQFWLGPHRAGQPVTLWIARCKVAITFAALSSDPT